MYASLLISLLAAFVAMLGKQWLNRYLRNAGGSMIERCGDRQRKFDGLKKWPFHLFVESLPVMLQVALLLLACGLCKNMASINTSVASVLISLTVLGVLFYLGIIITGTSSYECPFQTPVSIGLRSLWKKIGPHITPILFPIVAAGASLYNNLPHLTWEDTLFLCRIIRALVQSLLTFHPHSPPLPTMQPAPQEPTLWLAPLHALWENIECKILLLALHLPQIQLPQIQLPQIQLPQIQLPQIQLPQTTPPPTTTSTYQWLTPTALDTLQKTNTNDIQCVSWILQNITDPEALDAAIRLAATIRWFQDGLNTEPPYDLIISTLKGCIDFTGKIHPGSRGRAYSSAQAVLWIHVCAVCISEELALRFPLPVIYWDSTPLDPDLHYFDGQDIPELISDMFVGILCGQPVHLQWISNVLLHLSWAKQSVPSAFSRIYTQQIVQCQATMSVETMLNYLLVASIFLGQPIDEEVLKVQDKSYVIPLFHPPTCSYTVY
jgi:hypothetical protein